MFNTGNTGHGWFGSGGNDNMFSTEESVANSHRVGPVKTGEAFDYIDAEIFQIAVIPMVYAIDILLPVVDQGLPVESLHIK